MQLASFAGVRDFVVGRDVIGYRVVDGCKIWKAAVDTTRNEGQEARVVL